MALDQRFQAEINRGFIGDRSLDNREAHIISASTEAYLDQRANAILSYVFSPDSYEFIDVRQLSKASNKLAVIVFCGKDEFLEKNIQLCHKEARFFLESGDLPCKLIAKDSFSSIFIFRSKFYNLILDSSGPAEQFQRIIHKYLENFSSNQEEPQLVIIEICPLFNCNAHYSWASGNEEILEDDPWIARYQIISDLEGLQSLQDYQTPCRLSSLLQHCYSHFKESDERGPVAFEFKVNQEQVFLNLIDERFDNVNYGLWRINFIKDQYIIKGLSLRGKLRLSTSVTLIELDLIKETYLDGYSILIPFYNHFALLERCFKSVFRAIKNLERTIPVEIILMNDDVRYLFKEEDFYQGMEVERGALDIRIFNTEKNQGITENLNRGLRQCRYKWVLFLDCDDQLVESSLSKLHEFCKKNPSLQYVTTNMFDIVENSEEVWCRPRLTGQSFLLNGMFAGHLKCIKRSLFDQIGFLDEDFDGCQDFEFALRYSLFGEIAFLAEFLYVYTWHRNTQSITKYHHARHVADYIRSLYLYFFQCIKNRQDYAEVGIEFVEAKDVLMFLQMIKDGFVKNIRGS